MARWAMPVAVASLAILGLGAVVRSVVNRYAVRSPYRVALAPTRAFIHAARAGDAKALSAMGAAPQAIDWALTSARGDTGLLRALDADLQVADGMRNGDRIAVFFKSRLAPDCQGWPLLVFLAGSPSALRIEDARFSCVQGENLKK